MTVDGAGSTWTSTGSMVVGYSGTGSLTVSNHGEVSVASGSGTLQLALQTGSVGTLNVGNGGLSGTINAMTINGGAGTSVVNFNHTDDSALAAALTGSLSVNQMDSGTTV